MGAPKKYNGHHCYNCWNVALWLGNDEGLYNLAMHYVNQLKQRGGKLTARGAAYRMQADLPIKTPDGATYSIKALTAAIIGFAE